MRRISAFYQWSAVFLMVLLALGLMSTASLQESAIMDELAHIPAGYGYVRYLDYRLNPEHPPLVKMLSGLPLLFLDLNFPLKSAAWTGVNGQWQAGTEFLYQSGNDADEIINQARLGPMLIALILIVLVYIWARELLGGWWGLMPTFLMAFSPTILAHGHYVTTDIGVVLGVVLATYYFLKFLLKPGRRNLLLAGFGFGIAQLMKFSAVLLVPYFLFLILVFYLASVVRDWRGTAPLARPKRFLIRFFRYLRSTLIIFIIGYLLVYIFYFITTINYPVEKQVSDTKFILTSYGGGPDPNWDTCRLNSKIGLERRGRCLAELTISMAGNQIFRPLAQYLLGVLMVMQRSAGGNTAYFLGEVSAAGWWYYFPVVFLLKEPLPSLALIAIALGLSLAGIVKNFRRRRLKDLKDYLGTNFPEFSMIVFVIFYWLYSIQSPLNIGVRHILPTMPFIYILATSGLKRWLNVKNLFKPLKFALIILLLFWYAAETAAVSPYYLSYFNQFGGGIRGGYRYVTDSNYDWGQDLKRLEKIVSELKIDKIAVDYFGGGNPKYYLGELAEPWWSARGNPSTGSGQVPPIKWLAVSVNTLQGALGELHPGHLRKPEDEYRWLQTLRDPYQPDFRAGTSIFIYKLD